MRVPENDGPGDHTTVDSSPGGLMKTRDAGSGGPKLVSSRQRDGSCCDSECGWRQLYISGDAKVALCPARETRA